MLTRKILHAPIWLWLTLVVFVAGGALAYVVQLPKHAGWRYGACKVFLEEYVRFPTTLAIQMGGETRSSAVISFSDINPFGSSQIRVFECHYSQGPDGTALSRITLDRKALPDDVVKKFNAQLPLLAGMDLDTALPDDLPDDLEDLKK